MAYIFFDIDGTLWDEKMQIPESTIPTIKQLQKNGHKTFLCSGRSRSNINDKRLLGIGFDGIVAACGNHVEMDGKVLYENILSPELTEKIVRVMEECRMPIVLEGPDCHWIDKENFKTDPYVLYLFEAMGASAKILKGYSALIKCRGISCQQPIMPESGMNWGLILTVWSMKDMLWNLFRKEHRKRPG